MRHCPGTKRPTGSRSKILFPILQALKDKVFLALIGLIQKVADDFFCSVFGGSRYWVYALTSVRRVLL